CVDRHAVLQPLPDDLLTAVTLSLNGSVALLPCDRNRLPLVWMRPPNVELGPAKNDRSTSENMPNWNTGIATASIVRTRCVSPPGASAQPDTVRRPGHMRAVT